ncbi:MAG TPA: MlaD family protein [Spirochaetota bacterium]|nr:MCE family protein [Spirochaetota bacterium]HOD14274.1 MlaD family protein [Spirochaetota bacterium]HPG50593.1 MlaD family protein [Spirochaetota bacterium]HPN12194.1 MlaD family protein [Spirochaetota bacterium]HQL83525.1 MlaD family protein [Spirochaetota bacterium]
MIRIDRKKIIESMRRSLGRTEFRVGLFAIIPVALIVMVILVNLGYSLASSTIDVYVKVNSITSLQKGTPVQVKGYRLGRVVEIRPIFKPALHFLATLRIRKDIELYEDCAAVITNQNLIGDPVVELRNPEAKGAFLREGDVLEGIESGSIEDIMAKVNTLLTEATTIMTLYREVSQESRGDLRRLVVSLADSVANVNNVIQNSQKDIIDIIGSMRKTAQTLDEVSAEIKKNPMKFLFQGKK